MKRKYLYIGLSIVGIGTILYLITRRSRKFLMVKELSKPSNDQYVSSAVTKGNDKFPLQNGSEGERVKLVQKVLNNLSEIKGLKTDIDVDGIFGTQTYARLMIIVGKDKVTESDYAKFENYAKEQNIK